MLKIIGGETVKLRFRAQTPGGTVIRPPAVATVTVRCDGELVALPDSAAIDWDGREWVACMSTEGWKLGGTYFVLAEVSSPEGRGLASVLLEISDQSW